jgi:3-oxoisoapionate decarboxylase
MNIQLGISSYSYPWAVGVPGHAPARPLTAFDLLAEANRLNVSAVQYGDNLPLHQLSVSQWQALRHEADERGLAIQVGTKGLTTDTLKTYLKLAWEARSPFLRMVIDDGSYQPVIEEVVTLINQKLPALRDAGVMLSIENHDRFTAQELLYIATRTDPEWVGFCLDTTNSFGAGQTVSEVLTMLRQGRVVNLHAKDFTAHRVAHKMGFVIEGCEPGTGLVNLPALLLDITHGLDWPKQAVKPLPDLLNGPRRPIFPLTITLEQWPPLQHNLADTIAQEATWAETGVRWIQDAIQTIQDV